MPVEVEFRLAGGPQPLILVPARVNGLDSAPFILDTGAGVCLLSPELARRAGVAATGRQTAVGAGGPMEIDLGSAETLAVGDLEVRDLPVAITGDLERVGRAVGSPIEGDVGFTFLRHFRMTIDYVRSRLTLGRPGESSRDPRPAFAVPFRLAGPEKPLVLVPARIGGEGPFTFVVDTGASTTVLSREAARGLGSDSRRATTMVAGGGRVSGLFGSKASIGVGQHRGNPLDVVIGPFLDELGGIVGTRLDGILGHNFLRQFRVTFDYPGQSLELDPV